MLGIKSKESQSCNLYSLCVDAAPPTWEELQSVMLAVKVVVHGLVEFIQNFSKKSHETPQVRAHHFPLALNTSKPTQSPMVTHSHTLPIA